MEISKTTMENHQFDQNNYGTPLLLNWVHLQWVMTSIAMLVYQRVSSSDLFVLLGKSGPEIGWFLHVKLP